MRSNREPLAERFDRWTVRHPHTPVLRLLLRFPVALWRLGLGGLLCRFGVRHGYLVMLTVTGRSSGRPRHVAVTAHELDGRAYLWCPYGSRAQWYRNVIASPSVTVQSRHGTQTMRAVGIDDADEMTEVVTALRHFDEAFLRGYLAAEHIDDCAEGIAKNMHRLHIRRLEPTDEVGPPPLTAGLVWVWSVPIALAAVAIKRLHRDCRATSAGCVPSPCG